MAFYLRLQQQNSQFVAHVFENHREAEIHREEEYSAAIHIQSWFRGLRTRCYIKHLNDSAVLVQKTWRGFIGRQVYRKKLNAAVEKMLLDYYSAMATKIQKRWRGFYTRKYVHNFYARKHYLEMVQKKNVQIRERLEEYNAQAKQEMARHIQESRQRKVEGEARKSHYLVSTKTQPGVFNSPYRIYPHEMEFYMRTTKFKPESATPRRQSKKNSPGGSQNVEEDPLPPIKKLQGPFRSPGEVKQQRNKEFNPTLRVATDFLHLDAAREQDRLDEWKSRVHDDMFKPFSQYRYPYERLMHGQSDYMHLPDNYLRETDTSKHISQKDFKRVNSPIHVFDKFGDTYSKGAGAVC